MDFQPNAHFVGFDTETRLTGRRDFDHREMLGPPDVAEVQEDEAGMLIDDRRLRVTEFERRISKAPGDTTAWLEYAHSHDDGREEQQAQREVTMAILERALEQVPVVDRVPIILDQLSTAEALWTPAQLQTKWRERLAEVERAVSIDGASPLDMMRLWISYLDWLEGPGFGSNGHTADDVLSTYEELFRRAHQYSEPAVSHSIRKRKPLDEIAFASDIDRENHHFYLFARAFGFLDRSGFRERALALLQAQMEM